MLLTCPHCGDSNELANDSLPPAGARGACRRCGQTAVFDGQGLAPEGGFEDATPSNPLATGGGADDATPPHPLDAVAAAEEASAAGDAWHLNTAAGEQGPLTLAALKQLIRKDELTEHDHVFGPGQSEWMEAGHREELKRYFAIKTQARARADGAASAVGSATAVTAAASVELNASDPFAWCTRHPAVEAAWICHACNLSWCASCPEERNLPGGMVRTCLNCQRPVAERTRAKPITLWWKEMGQVWGFPVRGLAWTAIVALCCLWVAQLLGGFVVYWLTTAGILSYYLLLIRNVGEGGRRMPDLGKVERHMDELFWPGIKAVVVTVLAMLPFNLYFQTVALPAVVEYAGASVMERLAEPDTEGASGKREEGWGGTVSSVSGAGQREAFIETMRQTGMSEEEIEQMLAEMEADEGGEARAGESYEEDPWQSEAPSAAGVLIKLLIVVALAVYALVVWPLLMIIVAMFNTIAPVFNPPLILRIAKEVWPEYKRLLLFLLVVLIVSLPVRILATSDLFERMVLSSLGIPALIGFACVPLSFYLALVMMYTIGRTAELIDRKIDWF